MTLIEGVGDEVMQFGAVVVVVVVAALAWWSTNARPDRYRTVLVMRSRTHHPVTVSIRTRNTPIISNNQTNSSIQASTSESVGVASSSEAGDSTRDSSRIIPLQEMDSIVDADMAMLDNNRLHFYRRMDSPNNTQSTAESSDESEVQDEAEPASNAQIREMDSIVSAMEADATASCDLFARTGESNSSSSSTLETNNKDGASPDVTPAEGTVSTDAAGNAGEGNARKILIKLKYLNDTLKEVEGSLDELLKDFKRRHFSTELSSECRVRLIFNGRLLGDEAATLRALGLYDRAVVHCLVHPKRAVAQAQRGAAPAARREAAAPERPWDLENILMTLVSVALTVVWFFRCEYSNMFTASASVALFGLTVFYSVAIFGLYLSETFQFDRRPVPDN